MTDGLNLDSGPDADEAREIALRLLAGVATRQAGRHSPGTSAYVDELRAAAEWCNSAARHLVLLDALALYGGLAVNGAAGSIGLDQNEVLRRLERAVEGLVKGREDGPSTAPNA